MDCRIIIAVLFCVGVALGSSSYGFRNQQHGYGQGRQQGYGHNPVYYRPQPKRVSYTVSYWGEWGDYSSCNVDCGYGKQYRERECKTETRYKYVQQHSGYGSSSSVPESSNSCEGDSREEKSCNAGCCPVDGRWGSWESWSSWSKTNQKCDGYYKVEYERSRSRDCDYPEPSCGGDECEGDDSQTETSCRKPPCTGYYCNPYHNRRSSSYTPPRRSYPSPSSSYDQH